MTGTQADLRDPGLQAERTTLSWARTTFVVLAASGLIVVRDCQSNAGPARFFAAGLAAVAALIACMISARRQNALSRTPQCWGIAPRHEVHIFGASVVALWLAAAPLVLPK